MSKIVVFRLCNICNIIHISLCFSSHQLELLMLPQRHHSNQLGPMRHTAGPLVHHMVSLVLHPLQLSSLELLEQEVKISSCQDKFLLVFVPTHYVLKNESNKCSFGWYFKLKGRCESVICTLVNLKQCSFGKWDISEKLWSIWHNVKKILSMSWTKTFVINMLNIQRSSRSLE